jgi:hypothetical protein
MLVDFLGRVDSFFPRSQKKRLVVVATSHHSEAIKAFLTLEGHQRRHRKLGTMVQSGGAGASLDYQFVLSQFTNYCQVNM